MTSADVEKEQNEFFLSIEAQPSEKARSITHIYWVYMKWCLLNTREPLDKRLFSRGLDIKYKAHKTNGHETKYYVDCELLNLKYEDKLAIKEYTKEQYLWENQQAKTKRKNKKSRMTRRRKKSQLKKEKKQNTLDLKNNSSQELNKNTTTTTTSTSSQMPKSNG